MVETYTEQYKLTRDKINNAPVDLLGENSAYHYFYPCGGWAVDPKTYGQLGHDGMRYMGNWEEDGATTKYGPDDYIGDRVVVFETPLVQDADDNFCFKAPGYVKLHLITNDSKYITREVVTNHSGMSDSDAITCGLRLIKLKLYQHAIVDLSNVDFYFEYYPYQIFTKPFYTKDHDNNKKQWGMRTDADKGTVLWSNTTPQTDMPTLYLTPEQVRGFIRGGVVDTTRRTLQRPYEKTFVSLGCYVSTTVTINSGSSLRKAETYGPNGEVLYTSRAWAGSWALGAGICARLQVTKLDCSLTVQRTATLYNNNIAAITDLTAGDFEDVVTFDVSIPNTDFYHVNYTWKYSYTKGEHIFKHQLWKDQLDVYSDTTMHCPKYNTPVRPSNTLYITLKYNKVSDTLAEYNCSVNAESISNMVDDAAVSYTLTEWDTLGNRQTLRQVDMSSNRIDETSGTVTLDPTQDYVSYIQAEVHVTVGGVDTMFGRSMIVSVASSDYPMYIMQDIDGIGFFAPPENGYVTMPYLNYTYDAADENPDVHIMILGAGFFAHSSGAIGFISWYGIPRPDCIGYGKAVWHTQMLNDNIMHPAYLPNFTISKTAPMYDGEHHTGVEDNVNIKVVEIPMGGFYNDAKHTNCERSYFTTDYCKMHPGSGEAHNCFPCYIAGELYYVDEAKLAASWQQIIDTSGTFVENYEKYCVDLNGSVKIDKEIMIV